MESFPEVPVKINGIPTYTTLKQLRQTIKTNAASVDTIYGGGMHGHLGLVVPPHVYNLIVPQVNPPINAWIDPVHPGLAPAYPPNATDEQMETIRAEHKEQLRCWRLCGNVNKALQQQVINSIDPIYIRALRHQHTGYTHLLVRDLLHYLFQHYGRILPHALADNDKQFRKAWDPSSPFETLIDQIETAQELAIDGRQPYSQPQILSNALHLVQSTGVYAEDCKKWTAKPEPEKTWTNFKKHFLAAQEQFRLQQTAQHSGYLGYLLDQQINEKCIPILEAANSIVTASTAREEDLSTLSATHTAYAAQQSKLTEIIESLKKEVAELKEQTKKTTTPRPRRQRDPNGYCWTHGYKVTVGHNSKTCNKRKQGHKEEATRDNPMGGSENGKPNS